MGSFRVPIDLGHLAGGPGVRFEALVEGSEPLHGVFTLEGFGLAADPVNRRLIPVPGLLKLA
jgi:hypothetical protein